MSSARKVTITEDELGRRRVAHARKLKTLFDNRLSVASQTLAVYVGLFDDVLLDVAQEAHREAHTLGVSLHSSDVARFKLQPSYPDPQLNNKTQVDIFGQTHPAVAADIVACRNCGRQLAAGRFAPHLEKCLGKGRASARATRRVVAS